MDSEGCVESPCALIGPFSSLPEYSKTNASPVDEVIDPGRQQQAIFNIEALSARAQDGILKVSRTIADLGGSEQIQAKYIAEAIARRPVTRQDLEGA